MQPANKKPEVVYRRRTLPGALPTEAAATADLAKRAFVRAITPLIVGFLLLLALISWLGWRSAKEMEQIGENARDLASRTSVSQNLLSDLRFKTVQVDTEARVRHTTLSQKGFAPPFSFRLDIARDDLNQTVVRLNHTPDTADVNWGKLRADLQQYVELSKDVQLYSLKGHDLLTDVDKDIDAIYGELQALQAKNINTTFAAQRKARNSILTWSLIALGAGALVALGTIWQVQRHFWQMRRSMLEARRERTFTTQLLEGMVSAVATIDEEDRIRSANAAFFRIFPNASIGASVLELFASDDAMKLLETVTAVRVTRATYRSEERR